MTEVEVVAEVAETVARWIRNGPPKCGKCGKSPEMKLKVHPDWQDDMDSGDAFRLAVEWEGDWTGWLKWSSDGSTPGGRPKGSGHECPGCRKE